MPVTRAQKSTAKLDLRVAPAAKKRLQKAAHAANVSTSQYVLESALSRAENEAATQGSIVLNDRQWNDLMKALEAPPRDVPGFAKLFAARDFFGRTGKG